MHSYLKKTLVNRKSIFIYFFINTIIIYNFLIAKDENYINFDIYDTAIGYFGRIGALLVTYLLLVSILIGYYDKNYVIVRFKDIKEWITSIIKDQILLSIFFTIMINIVPVICILIHADLIDSFSWQVYLIVNTITQMAAFMASGFLVTFLYFKTLNLKVAVVIPFIIYTILNLIDNFLLNNWLNISCSFTIPGLSDGLVVFETCRKTLIVALIFYLMNVSLKKKRDLYIWEE